MNIAGQYDMPTRYEAALRSGLRFFVCRYPKRTPNDQQINGIFDVAVTENFNTNTQGSTYSEEWRTGRMAWVPFRSTNKANIPIAFIVDDRFYHNRVMIADAYKSTPLKPPDFYVEGMHTGNQGFISTGIVMQEIDALREVLYWNKPIYKVVNINGVEEDFFVDKADAKKFLDTEKFEFKGANGVPVPFYPYRKCRIVEGTTIDWKPEVAKIIRAHMTDQYGWTDSQAFRETVIPKVNDIIKKKRKDAQPRVSGTGFTSEQLVLAAKQLLSGLSPEDLEKLKRADVSTIMAKSASMEADKAAREAAVESNAESVDIMRGPSQSSLAAMHVESLRIMAMERSIPVEGKKKPELIRAILGSFGEDPHISDIDAVEAEQGIVEMPTD